MIHEEAFDGRECSRPATSIHATISIVSRFDPTLLWQSCRYIYYFSQIQRKKNKLIEFVLPINRLFTE